MLSHTTFEQALSRVQLLSIISFWLLVTQYSHSIQSTNVCDRIPEGTAPSCLHTLACVPWEYRVRYICNTLIFPFAETMTSPFVDLFVCMRESQVSFLASSCRHDPGTWPHLSHLLQPRRDSCWYRTYEKEWIRKCPASSMV